MLTLLLAYMTLLTFAIVRRDGGQVRTAGLLLANWLVNSAFVAVSDCVFPWTFFLTVDWLTALGLWVVLWSTRDGRHSHVWLRLLMGTYALELLMHAAYGIVSGDNLAWSQTDATIYWQQWRYYNALLVMAWIQIALVGSWIIYDIAVHRSRSRGSLPNRVARDGKAVR